MLKPFMGALSLLLLAAGKVTAGKLSVTDTITWGGDNSRSGYFSTHNLDPSVVGSSEFGQLWKAVLPGNYRGNPEQLYSQSLLYTLNDGIQYVFVSTTQNNIYKINAKTGAIVASRNLHVPFLTADLDGCLDINPTVGVTATGVIDPDTDTWYLTAKTYLDQSDQVKGRLNGRYYFHAIDVNTLAEKPGFPRGLEGIIGSNNANRMFQGGNAHQRPALLHTGQFIYAGFASHCVQYNFTGWIMGWDKTTGEVVERFTTEGGPEANTVPGGGVWMSGGGLATDDKGSMYFATGNGYASQLSGTPVPGRQPPTSLEEAAVNMKINDDGSLKVVDFFMPWEKVQLDGADKDLGTTPLELLQPNVFTCPNVKRMGVVTGKSGKIYILNLDNLGGYQQGPQKLDAVPQVIQNENSVYAGAGVYPLEGGYIYINYPTHVFKFSCDASGNPSFTKVADSPEKNAYVLGVGHGTTTSLNGQAGTGLLWVSDVDGYNLRVYNAIPVNGQLQLIKFANVAGITKFSRPVFGDGRAYLGTVQGALYCFGSPVNLPLTCTSPNDFGSVVINSTSTAKTIQCQANVDTQVTSITIKSSNFQISSLPTMPLSLTNGQNISFQAVFAPSAPGPLSNDVFLATTNNAPGFSTSVPVSLKGIGDSLAPLLAVSPNLVSFAGVITGAEAGGRDQTIIFDNQGDGVLTIKGLDYSIISETGALVAPNKTADGSQVGPFTFKGLPTTIPGNSQVVVNINFNPTQSGNFAVYVHVRTDGGTKVFDVVGTAGTHPVALLEFQAADGSGKWIPYTKNSPPFTFGNVFEQQTKILKMRLTNNGSSSAASLSVTVSKPPFGVSGIVGAQNGVDLAEGTILKAGESATADLYCSVPKSQVNTDSYNGSATWTMNNDDPNFIKQVIQFTCNAIAEQVGPLYPNGSAIYRYDGCWKENNPGRQLKVQLWGQGHDNTNGLCISACADKGYTYAGTQYVNECWCGNKIPNLQSNEIDCNYACSSDETETCGGNGYFHDGSFISLFTNRPGLDDPTPPTPPAVVRSVGNYNYTACYTEGSSGRSLGAQNTASDEMTIEKCAAFCTGYTYFGIEYASECYCDNVIGVGSAPTAETACSMTCSGNDTQICGGGNRLTLYTLKVQSGSSSSVSKSTTGSSASTVSSVSFSASPTATGPVAVPTAGAFAYQGCYTEGTNARALGATATASGDMTVEKCATFCAGYTYMGVEYSSECYCANTIGDGAVSTSDGCSMTCGGNPNEFCGGGNRLNLYKAGLKSSVTSSTVFISGTASSVSSISSIVSSTATGPVAVPTAGAFAYQGCYTEGTNVRALGATATASGDMTVEKCATFCAGFTYMGVEYSSECYCANTIGDGAVLTSDGCSMTCGGNPNEFCGGGNRLNLYKASVKSSLTSSTVSISGTVSSVSSISSIVSSTATGPVAVPTAGAFAYQGCYTEGTNARALGATATASGDMTVEKCATFCAGYTYMGVEYASECYCANTIGDGAVLTSDGCSMTCGGNSNEFCGGGNRLNLYKAGLKSSVTSSTVSVANTATSAASSTTVASSTASVTPSSTSSGPSAIKTAGSFSYSGCYTEGTNARALSDKTTVANSMTIEQCATFCSGYKYMGVEYSTECYCGNTIGAGAVSVGDGCTMTCGGNANEYCGGPNRLNFYKASSSSSSTVTSTIQTSSLISSSAAVTTTSSKSSSSGTTTSRGSSSSSSLAAATTSSKSSSSGTTISGSPSSSAVISTSSKSSSSGTTASTGSKSSSSSAATTVSSSSSSSGTAISTGSSSPLSSVATSTSSKSSSSGTTISTGSGSSSSSVATSTSPTSSSSRTTISTGSSSSSSSAATSTSSKTSSSGTTISTGSGSPSSSAATSTSSKSSSSGTTISTGSSSPSSSATSSTSSKSSSSTSTVTTSSGPSSSTTTFTTSTKSSSLTATSITSSQSSSTPASSSTNSKSSSSISAASTSSISSSSIATSITKTSIGSSTTVPSSTPTGPAVVQGNANFTYTACYVDSGARALSQLVLSSDRLTVELCLQACSQYTYAGMEYGRECWCDNTLASSATPATAESQCNMNCAGNSSEICGAGNRLTLYTHNPQSKAKAAFAVQAVPVSISVTKSSSLSSFSESSSVSPSLSITSSGFITSSKPSASGSPSSLSSTSISQSGTKSSTQLSSPSTPSGSITLKSSSSVSSSSSTKSSTNPLSSTISKSPSVSSSSKTISPSSFTTSTKPLSTSTTSKSPSATSTTSISKSSSSSKVSGSSTSKPSSPSSLTSSISKSSSSSVTSVTSAKSSSSKTSSTSARSTPTPSQVVKDWVYLGCANQTSPPALSGMMKSSPGQMTLEICQEYCIDNYYGLAAIENGDTCSCGNGLQSYSTLGHNSCNAPCAGNSSETCGGKDAQGNTYLSVWNSTSTTIIPTFVKQVGAYPRLGCYTDSAKHTLSAATYTNATGMSVESCVGYCITKNHDYAGLSNANTCFCDTKLAPASTLWDDVKCTKTCSGNSREFCGGEKAMLIYKRDDSSVVNGKPKRLNEDNTPLG